MNAIYYLVLLFATVSFAGACKGKSRRKSDETYDIPPGHVTPNGTGTEKVTVGTQFAVITEEPVEWTTIKNRRETKNFVVFIRNTERKLTGSGVRVLPNVILSSSAIIGTVRQAVEVTRLLLNGSSELLKGVYEINFPKGKYPDVCVVYMTSMQTPREDGAFTTIPLITRTDPVEYQRCLLYVMDEKATITSYPVSIQSKCEGMKFYHLCVENKEKHCFPILGVPLVCDNRLVGLSNDTKECGEILLFTSIAYYDHWITTRIAPRGFFDYGDLIKYSRAPYTLVAYKNLMNLCIISFAYMIFILD